ncbi:uncharacterized protein [Clytia hemisphaerica]|uniref:Uncharacterized protein n=1 Tax=Clytia hemisphaerica TaxID=252671 RepID=A0A7M5WJJ5_9CNID
MSTIGPSSATTNPTIIFDFPTEISSTPAITTNFSVITATTSAKITIIPTTAAIPTENTASQIKTISLSLPSWESSYYYFSSIKKPWIEAELDCNSREGHLTSILSSRELKFLQREHLKHVPKDDSMFWIGGNRHDDGTWRWRESDSTATFPYQFKDTNLGDCMVIKLNLNFFYWESASCLGSDRRYICKIPFHSKTHCRKETWNLNDGSSRGYHYPLSPVGTVVSRTCSANGDAKNFTQTCLRSGQWSFPRGWMENCYTKTTKELIDLRNDTVCTELYQTDCKTPGVIADKLEDIFDGTKTVTKKDTKTVADIIENIAKGIDNVQNETEVGSILTKTISITSVITSNKVSEEKNLQNIHTSLEKIADKAVTFLPVGKEIQISKPNVGFVGKKIKRGDITIASKVTEKSLQSAVLSPANSSSVDNSRFQAFVKIPESALDQSKENVSLHSFIYRSDESSAYSKNNQEKITSSHILSITISGQKIRDLESPINVTFEVLSKAMNMTPNCSFWDTEKGIWSKQGIRTIQKPKVNSILCQTNHLTNFALILDVSQTGANPLALQMITWVGCGISLASLILTVIVFGASRKLRKRLVTRLIICFSLSLITTLFLFLFGVNETQSKTSCQAIAGLIQYFLLMTFFWMGAQGINLYNSLVRVMKKKISDTKYFLRSCVVNTVVPALIVIISASVKSSSYGGEKFCLVHGMPFYFGLLLPICFIILMNIILLSLVIYNVHRTPANIRSSRKESSKKSYMFKLTKITIACSTLLGIAWLFGVLAVGKLTMVMQYLFCIFNSLQGLFVLVFYVLTNEEVKKEWLELLGWDDFSIISLSFGAKKGRHDINTQSTNDQSRNSQSDDTKMGFKGVYNSYSPTSNEEPRYVNPSLLKQNPAFTMEDEEKDSNVSPYLVPAKILRKSNISDKDDVGLNNTELNDELEFQIPEEFHFESPNVSTNQASNRLPEMVTIPQNDFDNKVLQNDSTPELDCYPKTKTDIFDRPRNEEIKHKQLENDHDSNPKKTSSVDLKNDFPIQTKDQSLKDKERPHQNTVVNYPDSLQSPTLDSMKTVEPTPKEESLKGNTALQPDSNLKTPEYKDSKLLEGVEPTQQRNEENPQRKKKTDKIVPAAEHGTYPLQEEKSTSKGNEESTILKPENKNHNRQPPKVLKFRPQNTNPASDTTKKDIDARGNFRKTLKQNILQHKESEGAKDNSGEDDDKPTLSLVDQKESVPFRSKALSLSSGKACS